MMKTLLRRILLLAGACLFALVAVVLARTFLQTSRQIPAPDYQFPGLWEGAAERLAGAIRIPTISYPDSSLIDTLRFPQLHAWLRESFPGVHRVMELEKVNNYSLLFTWKGRQPDLPPFLLLAHQDVVPVEPGTEKLWTFPPFEGQIRDGFIYGRGSLDDKVGLMGLLEAAEGLISEGFQPDRSILFAFGHDEEISGKNGARQMARLLSERGIRPTFILDEGLVVTDGIVPGAKSPVALIGTAEKGFLTLRYSIELEGGHSAMPAKNTATGNLIQGLSRLTGHEFPLQFTQPVKEFMEFLGPELPFSLRMAFANSWLFGGIIKAQYAKLNSGRALLQTSMAPTLLRAGVRDNVIPVNAEAYVNFRILPGQSCQDITDFSLLLMNDSLIKAEVTGLSNDPGGSASINSQAFQQLQSSIMTAFPEAIVAPSLVTVTTDARHYSGLTTDIYRFLPVKLNSDDLKGIHGANERIATKAYLSAIHFYYHLMKSSGSGPAKKP